MYDITKTNMIPLSLFALMSSAFCYEFICPSLPHWNYRAAAKCNSTNDYKCMWDINEKKYKELCEGTEYQMKGFKRIIAGHSTRHPCSTERYQPYTYTTKGNFHCVFDRTTCNENGQIVYDHGNIVSDRTCRCDHKKGFKFIHKPQNLCYCEPTKEDCSCVVEPCSGSYIFDIDYECQPRNNWKTAFKCEEPPACYINSPQHITEEHSKTKVDDKKHTINSSFPRTAAMVVFVLSLLSLVILSVVVWISSTTIIFKKNKEIQEAENKANKLEEKLTLTFRCRFCGKHITDSSKYVKQMVDRPTVSALKLRRGTVFQEVISDELQVGIQIFTTREAYISIHSKPPKKSNWFQGYEEQFITCTCYSPPSSDEAKNDMWKHIGMKYTKQEAYFVKGQKDQSYFYGLLIDLVLDDDDYVLCKTEGCHAKVAKGCFVTCRPANQNHLKDQKYIEFAKQRNVLIQKIKIQDSKKSKVQDVTILTFSEANVSISKTKQRWDMTAFDDFKCREIKCFQCQTFLGWKCKPNHVDASSLRVLKFYALIKDRLIDASAELP